MKRKLKLALSTLALVALPSLFLAAPAWATDFSGTCTQFNSATGPFVNITITDTACVPITKAITATSGLVNIQVNTLSAQNITSGASGALTISSTGSISALALKSGTNQPLTVGTTTGGSVTATSLTAGKDLTLTYGNGMSTISGNISAVGNINISGYLLSNLTVSGTVKSTGAAGAGSILIKGVDLTTGDISTTANTVTVQGMLYTDLSSNVNIGSITTTEDFISVSAAGVYGGSIKTGALQTSTAYINVAANASVDIEGLVKTTQGYIFISGAMDTVKVTGAINTTGGTSLSGNVYIKAGSTLQTGAITSSLGGSVDINAQTMGGSSLFTIGGSGQTNGVNGKITTTGGPFNGLNPYSVWVNVANGPTGATGGITLTATDDISVDAGTGARLGTIVLNAQNGPLTIPAGTMTVAGTGAIGGGQINLLGATITFSGASVLNASQATTADGFGHQVDLSAATINYSAGLTVTSSGTGVSALHGQAGLYSQNAFTAVDSYGTDITTLTINVSPTNATPTALTLAGGDLTMTANGDYTDTLIQGYPITISGGNVTLTSQGVTNTLHTVAISNTVNGSPLTGTTGLTFGGSTVTLDASATNTAGDAGGFVTITVDQAFLNASTFLIKANGPTVAGNGGNVFITASTLTLNGSSKATITANASSAGIGNAVSAPFPPAIYINPTSGSAIKLGAGAGEFSLSAQGGKTGGNAGSVVVLDPMGSIEFDSTGTGGSLAAINVSVLGAVGEGGYVSLTSGPMTFDGTASTITANGGATTSGDGGQIILNSSSAITVGTGATGDVTVSAQAPKLGNGGTVTINSNGSALTLNTAQLNVASAVTGTGGTVNLTSGALTVNGTINTNGGTTSGNGGNIAITASGAITGSSASLLANAQGTTGANNGGTITINETANEAITIGTGGSSLNISATGAGNGNGGNVTITSVGGLEVSGSNITVGPGTSATAGAGGNIALTGLTTTLTGTLSADGKGTGNPGTINITQTGMATAMILSGATMSASADTGGNAGGHNITITSSFGITMTGTTLTANGHGSGTGPGGTINISASGQVNLTTALITAMGATQGPGGVVIVSSTTPFDVNTIINVNGGTSLGNLVFDGSITLSNVACVQYKTGYDWPSTFWDCTGNPSPTAQDLVSPTVATGLTNLKGLFESYSKPTQMYVFTGATAYNAFWVDSQPSTAGGIAFAQLSSGASTANLYIAPFESGSIGGPTSITYNDSQQGEIAGHELGHAEDLIAGFPSIGSTYDTYPVRDMLNLDYSVVGSSAATSTLRAPCGTGAPFTNITNLNTGNPVCVSNALNTVDFPPAEGPYINSYVLAVLESAFYVNTPPPFWVELHAQMFSYQNGGDQGARPMNDGVGDVGFFPCMQSWAAAELAGNTGGPASPNACTTIPTWYEPFQNP